MSSVHKAGYLDAIKQSITNNILRGGGKFGPSINSAKIQKHILKSLAITDGFKSTPEALKKNPTQFSKTTTLLASGGGKQSIKRGGSLSKKIWGCYSGGKVTRRHKRERKRTHKKKHQRSKSRKSRKSRKFHKSRK